MPNTDPVSVRVRSATVEVVQRRSEIRPRSESFTDLGKRRSIVFPIPMSITTVDLVVIIGGLLLTAGFLAGPFVGARLTRVALGSRPEKRTEERSEVRELVRVALEEVVGVLRERRQSRTEVEPLLAKKHQ